jgi:hypothetical protein
MKDKVNKGIDPIDTASTYRLLGSGGETIAVVDVVKKTANSRTTASGAVI